MRPKKISRSLYTIVIGIAAFTASFLVMVSSVYAADFNASFSPAADAVEQDANTTITISFDRAVYVDAEGGVFTDTTLKNVVSLHTTDADGTTIPFAASIDAGNTEITIDPTDTLSDGAVYIAISDAYYDKNGLQGDAASAIFSIATVVEPVDTAVPTALPSPVNGAVGAVGVIDPGTDVVPTVGPADTTAPTVSFSPVSGATVVDASTDVVLTFDEAVYQDTSETAFDTTALSGLITLKSTDENGTDIPFSASINAGNTKVTIDPTNDLANGAVYVAVSNGYYDAADNQGATATNTFTIAVPIADTTAPTVSFSPVSGATVVDASTDVVLTFDEAVYQDTSETAFDTTALSGLITLKSTDENGTDIPFSASINAGNTKVTIDPTNDLANGAVYVAVSNGYYDAADNQGATATNTFTIAVPIADTTAPTVSFSPVSGATVVDASTDVVLTFDEAVYQDTSETAFDTTALSGLITLKSTDENGTDIPFSASINAGNTKVTIDPTNDLANGAVYVAVSNGYYDAADNQGATATNTFTIAVPIADTTAPTVSFSPVSGATVVDASTDVVLTFDEAVYQDTSETAFDTTALSGLITLKSTDENGTDIPFSASINAGNTKVTIDPTNDLANGAVYVAVSNGYYDAADNQGATATNTFTIAVPIADTTAPTVSFSPVSGATVVDASTDVVLTFDEAVYQDTSETAFDTTALSGLITLKSTDENGTDIPFSASINAGNTKVTIDPTNDLANGAVYVAVSNGYYDAADNQGATATNTFTIAASTGFVVTSTPEDGTIIEDNAANITITFNQAAYRDINKTLFTTNDLASFVVLRTDDVYGYGIPFEANMSNDNMTITINPMNTLQDGAVYIAISGDYYNTDKARGVPFNAIFSVDTGTPPPLDDFFSHLLATSPFSLLTSSVIVNTPNPSIQASEEFREAKLQEALSLLRQALELLSIVVAIDNTSPPAPTTPPAPPTVPTQDSSAGTEEVSSTTRDTTTESSDSNILPASSDTPSGNIPTAIVVE